MNFCIENGDGGYNGKGRCIGPSSISQRITPLLSLSLSTPLQVFGFSYLCSKIKRKNESVVVLDINSSFSCSTKDEISPLSIHVFTSSLFVTSYVGQR